MLKHCPEVTITVNSDTEKSDYALVLNREAVGLFGEGLSQIMLVRTSDKSVLWAVKKGTVAQAVKAGCKALMADWQQHLPAPTGADWWNHDTTASKDKR